MSSGALDAALKFQELPSHEQWAAHVDRKVAEAAQPSLSTWRAITKMDFF
jgi:hypothetical protein